MEIRGGWLSVSRLISGTELKSVHILFFLCLALLPFAEWKILVLPINGKSLDLDLTGYASVSLFDVAFLFFAIAMWSEVRLAIKQGIFRSFYLAYWAVAIVLIAVLFFVLKPLWPFLTPSQVNVIDTRSLIVHFAVMVFVTALVARLPMQAVVKTAVYCYSIAAGGFLILSILVFSGFRYFRFHYPFSVPTEIAFPFPNQNVAAPFITICLIGLCGSAIVIGKRWLILVGVPTLVLAAALTGSRSNMFFLVTTISLLWVAYAVYFMRGATTRLAPALKPLVIVPAIAMSVVLIAVTYDWHPVRRSLSFISDVMADPLTLVRAQSGSPRNELWSHARAGTAFDNIKDTRGYAVALVSVTTGKISKSSRITGLIPGHRYYIRLGLKPRDQERNTATLRVYRDAQRTQLLGSQTLTIPGTTYRDLYLFVADSDKKFTIVDGGVGNHRLTVGGINVETDLLNETNLDFYQDRFNGGATPIVKINERDIVVDAHTKILRAYVNMPYTFAAEDREVVLDYDVQVTQVTSSMPLDPPAMFYVGFHDSDSRKGKSDWGNIRNGLLVQHIREVSAHEEGIRRSFTAEWIAWKLSSDVYKHLPNEKIVAILDKESQFGTAGWNKITNLWKEPISQEIVDKAAGDQYSSIVKSSNGTAISVVADDSWSATKHLKYKGSTHNVYLDLLYYVGVVPLLLFLFFVGSFILALAIFVWRHRFSTYLPFYLATALQVVVIFGLMYAQPYLWIKYFWVIFGVATGMMINRSAEKPLAAREIQ